MKKIGCVLLCLVMYLSFFGCSADKTVDNTANPSSTQQTLSEKANGNSAAQTGSATTNKTGSSSSNSVSDSKTTTQKNSGGNENTPSSEKSSENAARRTDTTAKQTATKKTTTTSSTVSCRVTIECSSILDNMDDLKEGHEDYIPDDGIIISNCYVTVNNGDTVYDAVKSACSENGVSINARSSSYGIYVAGFNNIDEKDCGSESGWLYKVNGKMPNKSCGNYKVSNGDNIVFTYTCSYK